MNDQKQRSWEIMKSIGACFFVTKDADGEMHGRPMQAMTRPEQGRIYLLTHESESKTSEHALADGVLLTFSSTSQNLALNGSAEVKTDRALVADLWNPVAQAFWPDGPTTPGVVAIEIIPSECEYWDGNGRMVSAVKVMYARLTHGKPDLGENRKVMM